MKRKSDNHTAFEQTIQLPFELVEKIANEIYELLVFISFGLSCRALLPLLKNDKRASPIKGLMFRNYKKFIQTLNFYYREQYQLAFMYNAVRCYFRHITEIILPYNRVHRKANVEAFFMSCNGWFPLDNLDGRPLTFESLINYFDFFTIRHVDEWCIRLLRQLDTVLGRFYMKLGMKDIGNTMYYGKFDGGITLNMIICITATSHICK